ncbi:uncharacterized protein LOC143018170 isoform X2 [Oratosquilla oratoria]
MYEGCEWEEDSVDGTHIFTAHREKESSSVFQPQTSRSTVQETQQYIQENSADRTQIFTARREKASSSGFQPVTSQSQTSMAPLQESQQYIRVVNTQLLSDSSCDSYAGHNTPVSQFHSTPTPVQQPSQELRRNLAEPSFRTRKYHRNDGKVVMPLYKYKYMGKTPQSFLYDSSEVLGFKQQLQKLYVSMKTHCNIWDDRRGNADQICSDDMEISPDHLFSSKIRIHKNIQQHTFGTCQSGESSKNIPISNSENRSRSFHTEPTPESATLKTQNNTEKQYLKSHVQEVVTPSAQYNEANHLQDVTMSSSDNSNANDTIQKSAPSVSRYETSSQQPEKIDCNEKSQGSFKLPIQSPRKKSHNSGRAVLESILSGEFKSNKVSSQPCSISRNLHQIKQRLTGDTQDGARQSEVSCTEKNQSSCMIEYSVSDKPVDKDVDELITEDLDEFERVIGSINSDDAASSCSTRNDLNSLPKQKEKSNGVPKENTFQRDEIEKAQKRVSDFTSSRVFKEREQKLTGAASDMITQSDGLEKISKQLPSSTTQTSYIRRTQRDKTPEQTFDSTAHYSSREKNISTNRSDEERNETDKYEKASRQISGSTSDFIRHSSFEKNEDRVDTSDQIAKNTVESDKTSAKQKPCSNSQSCHTESKNEMSKDYSSSENSKCNKHKTKDKQLDKSHGKHSKKRHKYKTKDKRDFSSKRLKYNEECGEERKHKRKSEDKGGNKHKKKSRTDKYDGSLNDRKTKKESSTSDKNGNLSSGCSPNRKTKKESSTSDKNGNLSSGCSPNRKTKKESSTSDKNVNLSSGCSPNRKTRKESSTSDKNGNLSSGCSPNRKTKKESSTSDKNVNLSSGCSPNRKTRKESSTSDKNVNLSSGCSPNRKTRKESSTSDKNVNLSSGCSPNRKTKKESSTSDKNVNLSSGCSPNRITRKESSTSDKNVNLSSGCSPNRKTKKESSTSDKNVNLSSGCSPNRITRKESSTSDKNVNLSSGCSPNRITRKESSTSDKNVNLSSGCSPNRNTLKGSIGSSNVVLKSNFNFVTKESKNTYDVKVEDPDHYYDVEVKNESLDEDWYSDVQYSDDSYLKKSINDLLVVLGKGMSDKPFESLYNCLNDCDFSLWTGDNNSYLYEVEVNFRRFIVYAAKNFNLTEVDKYTSDIKQNMEIPLEDFLNCFNYSF